MSWSAASQAVRATLDTRLQRLVDRLNLEIASITLLVGHRNEHDQTLAFVTGHSKTPWPKSKHNSFPSHAVDFCTYPVNLKSSKLREELAYVAGAANVIAKEEGFIVRWGGDWDQDGDLDDQKFDDLFHLEIKED